jgi:agmatinase
MDEIQRVAYEIVSRDKFLVTLGGEHSITTPLVAATKQRHPSLSVLQIDAHADLREAYMGTIHNHACAMRRVLDLAPLTQVGIRSLSSEEAAAVSKLKTNIFYDVSMRRIPQWVDRVVDSLGDTVYITIDVDGMDPAIMPATGTPEPGGLSWYEILELLRATISRRRVVACDVVELSPIPGLVAPNFLCSKLVYKILSYQFTKGR